MDPTSNPLTSKDIAHYLQTGHIEFAIQHLLRHLAGSPQDAIQRTQLVGAYIRLGLYSEAMRHARQLHQQQPHAADTQFNIGYVSYLQGDLQTAIDYYMRALAADPAHYGALRNIPLVCNATGQSTRALRLAAEAIAYYPKDPWLYYNRGELLLADDSAQEAIEAFTQALLLDSVFYQAQYARAIAYSTVGDFPAAQAARAPALSNQPSLLTSYRSPLVLDHMQGSNDLRPERIFTLASIARLRACDWRQHGEFAKRYAELVDGIEGTRPLDTVEMPYLALGLDVSEAVRLQVARQTSTRIAADLPVIPLRQSDANPNRRLRIGYLAADFRNHPTTWLTQDLYRLHDRTAYEIFAYATDPVSDTAERKTVASTVDHFAELGHLSPENATRRIRLDRIDILVDLSGYTLYAKPECLAMRAAPIQISYMGFMGSYGAPWMDYAFQDRTTMTPSVRPWWDEKIIYLPDCMAFCSSPEAMPNLQTIRAHHGLGQDSLVLAALHMPRKLDPLTFDKWLDILRKLPHAQLWLLEETPQQAENLRRYAINRDVAVKQLVFASLTNHTQHLQRYALADVFLDTFAYNGHTTMADALGMGLPAVTLRGETPVARVGASMLKAHGLAELIATTPDDYAEIVCRLASDDAWRAAISTRAKKHQDSRLFNPLAKTRQLETAYRAVWQRHIAGLPAEDFDVPEWSGNISDARS